MGISIQNIGTTSATLYYSGTSVDYTYRKDIDWYLDGSYVGSSVISPGDWGSNGCWLSGLSPNTYYNVRANITWYSGGGGTKSETSSFRTLAQSPIINNISATPTKNTVWIVVDANYTDSYDFRLYYRSGDTTGSLVEEKLGRLSNSIEFSGLKASRQYRVNVTARNSSGNISWNRDFTTLDYPRPNNFYWSNSARNIFTGNGFTNEVQYTEWNDFVQRVKEFYMWYWNISNDRENIESAKMTNSNTVLYAAKFNKVRASIGSMVSTGLVDFTTNDNVLGSYFILLESKMNSVTQPRSILEDNYIQPMGDEVVFLYNDCFDELDEIDTANELRNEQVEVFLNANRC